MLLLTATKSIKTLAALLLTASLLILILVNPIVNAADVTNRYVQIGDSATSVTTIHTIGFDIVSAGDIGSLAFEYCSNSPLDDDPCTPISGMDLTVANLANQSGETGFSIHSNTTANRLVLTRPAATPTPGPAQYVMSNVINPDTVGSQYVRVYTYLSTDGTGSAIDRGGLAFATTDVVSVQAYVPPVLLFCVGTTITGTNCSTAVGNSLNFGILSSSSTSTGTSQMAAGTNGIGGYVISVLGTTMTSGNNVINALTTPTLSSIGTQQFGLNLVSNTSPSVGQSVTGPGTASPRPEYSQVNRFKFVNGDTVAEAVLPSDMDKYTVSYIVNVPELQKPGLYSSTLTYVALATF